jgi:hypothetical protein
MTIEQILGLKALDKAVSSFGREDRFPGTVEKRIRHRRMRNKMARKSKQINRRNE